MSVKDQTGPKPHFFGCSGSTFMRQLLQFCDTSLNGSKNSKKKKRGIKKTNFKWLASGCVATFVSQFFPREMVQGKRAQQIYSKGERGSRNILAHAPCFNISAHLSALMGYINSQYDRWRQTPSFLTWPGKSGKPDPTTTMESSLLLPTLDRSKLLRRDKEPDGPHVLLVELTSGSTRRWLKCYSTCTKRPRREGEKSQRQAGTVRKTKA